MTRVCWPALIAAQAWSCTAVGAAKAAVNQSRVAGVKVASAPGAGSFEVGMDPDVVGRSPSDGRERNGTRLG